MMYLYQFIADHEKRHSDGIRLGQRFVNSYVIGTTPRFSALFHEVDDARAQQMIIDYLEDMCYVDLDGLYLLPPVVSSQ